MASLTCRESLLAPSDEKGWQKYLTAVQPFDSQAERTADRVNSLHSRVRGPISLGNLGCRLARINTKRALLVLELLLLLCLGRESNSFIALLIVQSILQPVKPGNLIRAYKRYVAHSTALHIVELEQRAQPVVFPI